MLFQNHPKIDIIHFMHVVSVKPVSPFTFRDHLLTKAQLTSSLEKSALHAPLVAPTPLISEPVHSFALGQPGFANFALIQCRRIFMCGLTFLEFFIQSFENWMQSELKTLNIELHQANLEDI